MSVNYAPLGKWGGLEETGVVRFNGDPQITFLDSEVTYAGMPSIRIEAQNAANPKREVNAWKLPVYPGDLVIMSAVIKTAPSPAGGLGAIIGFDLFNNMQRLWEITQHKDPNNTLRYPPVYDQVWMPYGSDWTYYGFSFQVPSIAFIIQDNGVPLPNPLIANSFIPWFSVSRDSDAYAWMADPRVYIRPGLNRGLSTLNGSLTSLAAWLPMIGGEIADLLALVDA